MTFVAVQFKESETAHQLVERFMKTSANKDSRFNQLEVLGTILFGKNKYLRFRTDSRDVPEILGQLLLEGRGVVHQEGGGYAVKLPTGKKGPASAAAMQSIGDPALKRVYKGTAVQFWDRQFMPS